jgi:trans-2,3-dihydro-3-hydroxyanthranilate isomerase
MTGDVRYRIVDVFSDRALAGNALCVVLDPCPEAVLQPLAREVNLSETTYPSVTGASSYDVRIFTPTAELPFAGHPTLGTAWVIGAGASGRWTQTSPGATVVVDIDKDWARMIQPVPAFSAWPVDLGLDPLAALGLPAGQHHCVVAEAGGVRHVLVATEAPIGVLSPDLSAVARATAAVGALTCGVVRRLDDRTLHVRVFVPSAGIAEDPGTGSAAGPITVLAHERLGSGPAVTIRQGDEIARPCRIEVELSAEGPAVGGRVTACAEGRFAL